MAGYWVRRIALMVPTFFLGSVVIFVIAQLPPWDFVDYFIAQMGTEAESATELASKLRELYGLNKPIYAQYLDWISSIFRGDFGKSLLLNEPVQQILTREIGLTAVVGLAALAVSWVIGIPLGVYSAVKQYSLGDYVLSFVGLLGLSIPNFFLALTLMYLAVVVLRIPYVGGLFSENFATGPWTVNRVIDFLKHLWPPVLVIGTAEIAQIMRIMRSNLLDILSEQYVLVARAKGLDERKVVYKHAIRNAINPLISLAGMQLPRIFNGVVITAVVLNLPIMGPTFLRAISSQDIYLISGYLMVFFVTLLIGNCCADLILSLVDPRIRY